MQKIKAPQENIDIYVWEGKSDIYDRIVRCLVSAEVDVMRADGMDALPEQPKLSPSIAIISVTMIDGGRFNADDWQKAHGMPVIWVAEAPRAYDSRVYPPEYSHILMLDFTCAELRRLVFGLAGELHGGAKSTQEKDPLIAESDVMKTLLKETIAFADCDSNVLIAGETGVGKERIARLLHENHQRYGKGPFVAVNCGAIPDGLFESHFFGHAKGAFIWRPQASHAVRHGPMPGLLLQCPAGATHGRTFRIAFGGRRRCVMAAPFEKPESVDALVVGAGPAGLAAATRLKRLGLARVVVADREQEAGGVPRHCGHPPFGMHEFGRVLTGPAYARRLTEAARRVGVELMLGHTVVAIDTGERMVATCASSEGSVRIAAERIILATGVRETPRAARLVSGDRPLGVLNTGALQAYVYLEHLAPFRRPVIVGTELVSLSSLLTCRAIGARPVAMLEENMRPTTRRPFMALPRLLGVPVHYGTRITDIKGKSRVESVTLSRADGTSEDIACDGVLFTGCFTPEASLARAAGLDIDSRTGGPTIDQFARTSEPRIFAAGNVLHPVETAGWSWQEGVRVADFVAADLGGWLPSSKNAITLTPGDGVRYVVPQRLVRGNGGLPQIQLRASYAVSGALVARSGGQQIATKAMTSGPERRILAPLAAFRQADADITFSFDNRRSTTSRSDATCV